MPGTPARLGPFAEGLNTLSDPSAVSDSELVDCINFDIDLDGSLLNRPPITLLQTIEIDATSWFILPNGNKYLIGSSAAASQQRTENDNWIQIATMPHLASVQYQNFVWLFPTPGSAVGGRKWDGVNPSVAVATLPPGSAAVVHKERIWLAPGKGQGSRIKFSKPAQPDVWDASDFIDVGAGDGEDVIDIIVYQGSLIIFKTNSTWSYAFESDPARGALNKISGTVGVSDVKCVVQYENNLYVYHESNVYEMANYNYSRLNYKVIFEARAITGQTFDRPVGLSLLGDRLHLRYYGWSYVFGLRTRTWTKWDTSGVSLYPTVWFEVPSNLLTNPQPAYLGTGQGKTVRFVDGYNATQSEEMTCYLRTRNYDFQVSHMFKRLFWWGIDVVSNRQVRGEMTPITYTADVTWADLETSTWADLENNTWAQPLLPNLTEETIVNATGAGLRKFIKFLRSTRFRQIFFEASMDTNGTSSQPVRLFNFTAVIGTKATVSQQIS